MPIKFLFIIDFYKNIIDFYKNLIESLFSPENTIYRIYE
jgi:hypothetical protein